MTTSNTTIFELTRDQIIEAAMRKCGALAEGASPTSAQLTIGQQALNSLISQYQTLGMPLWKRTQYSLTLVAGTNSYTIGVGQTTNTAFPLKLLSAVYRTTNGGAVQEMTPIAREQFNLLNQSSTGKPTQYTYQPFVNSGVLKVWPTPDSTSASAGMMELTYTKPVDGFTSASETPDFPQEWQLPLIYGLAVLLAPEYGVPLNDRSDLRKEKEMYLDLAKDYNYENASVFLQIDRDE